MGLRESLPPLWLAAVAGLAGVTAGVVWPKGDRPAPSPAPVPAPAPAPSPAPAPAPKVLAIPGAPPADIAAALGETIPVALGADATPEGFARLKELVGRWAASSPRDPLASAPWWRAALRRSLPTGEGQPRGVVDATFPLFGDPSPIRRSLPEGPGPFPVVLVLLDGGTIEDLYGDLRKSHAILGLRFDETVAQSPGIALVALADAARRVPLDPDRVVLDGTGRAAAIVETLADDAARQLSGVILRDRPAPAPGTNLDLLAVGRGGDAAAITAWIASVPPRVSSDPRRPVAWRTVTGDRYRSWGPGFAVRRLRDAAPDRAVSVRMSRDPAANAITLETSNVAEILLLLTDEGLDLDRPVKVIANGTVVHEKPVPRSLDAVRAWSSQGEAGLFVAAELSVRIPE